MYTTCAAFTALILGCMVGACAHKTSGDPQFYNNPQVRACLEIEKQNLITESWACWSKLHKKLITDPGFKQRSHFTDSDISRIQQLADSHDHRARKLEDELEVCLKLPIDKRKERIDCLKAYRKRHDNTLSLSEKFEIDNSISNMLRVNELVSGRVEATLEHAGKLLGAKLHQEEVGIRIDAVIPGPLEQAGAREQGLIVAVGDIPIADLEPVERITHLDKCQEKPINLLVRQGGIQEINFMSLELKCGASEYGRLLTRNVLSSKTCSLADSPEIRLGLSWCYLAQEGTLQVEQVCADSPASLAGIYPDQIFTSINGIAILGQTKAQIDQMLSRFPTQPILLGQKRGSLLSPDSLKGTPLSPERASACWRAIESVRHPSRIPRTP